MNPNPAAVNPPDAPTLTIGEVARRLYVSVDTIRRWEANGKISAVRTPGGQRRFATTEVERILAGRVAT